MGTDVVIAAATVFGVTVVPLASLVWGIHVLNMRARVDIETRRREEAARVASQRRKERKRLFKRLDHLDGCIDDVREKVKIIEGRRVGDHQAARP